MCLTKFAIQLVDMYDLNGDNTCRVFLLYPLWLEVVATQGQTLIRLYLGLPLQFAAYIEK